MTGEAGSSTQTDTAEDTPPPRRRRRARRLGLWTLAFLVVLTALAGLGALSLTGRSLTAPTWLTERVESRINAGLPSGRVRLGRMVLAVEETGVPRIVFRNVGLYDDSGAEIARLNDASARLALAPLVRGEVRPERLRLAGAQIVLRRSADGTFALSFGGGDGPRGTLAGVLDAFDRTFSRAPLGSVEEVAATGLTVSIEDARSGRVWQVTEGELTLENAAGALDLSVAFEVFNGTEDLARTRLGIRTDKGSAAASLGATFQNAAAADIALQAPALAFLGVLDAPMSGALRAEIDGEGELEALAGTLRIDAGALQPAPQTRPVAFDRAQAYFEYDPVEARLDFTDVAVEADTVRLDTGGHAYLRDFSGPWPTTLLGQFSIDQLATAATDFYAVPLSIADGAVDFRLRLDPFTLDVGQLVLVKDEMRLVGEGRARAGPEGWEVGADLSAREIGRDRLMSLWPDTLTPRTRTWLGRNVLAGTFRDVHGAMRLRPGKPPVLALDFEYSGAEVRFLQTLPTIKGGAGYASIRDRVFTLEIEEGAVRPASGGAVDVAGSVVRIPRIGKPGGGVEIALAAEGSLTAALSFLRNPPFNVLRDSDLPVDMADGRADLSGDISVRFARQMRARDADYTVTGTLRDVATDVLVPDRRLAAHTFSLAVDPTRVEIAGTATLDGVPVDGRWRRELGPEAPPGSVVEGVATLSDAALSTFGVDLPAGFVSGEGEGAVTVRLVPEAAPRLSLTSDLAGLRLSLPPVGWAKAPGSTGTLVVEGDLGDSPRIDRLELAAPGLRAEGGSVTLAPGGGLEALRFGRVRIGDWLDAPVVLSGRGAGAPPAVALTGGRIDLRGAEFGGRGGAGAGGPISLALDRLTVSRNIALTGFRAQLSPAGGLSGNFSGQVNGGTPVAGRLAPDRGGTGIRVDSDDAGATLRDAGLLSNARGGRLSLQLRPTGAEGTYDGTLTVVNTTVTRAPALSSLLSAISVVGLIDQLNSGGITFTDIDARFRLSPQTLTVFRSAAVGPSLGVSLDGFYDLGSRQMDFQGVISPIYFINAFGQLFSRRGEGLFGFNFRLRGAPDAPQVQVNPLSILTPGMFREIFRRPPPERPAETQTGQ